MAEFLEDFSVVTRPAPPPDTVVSYGSLDDQVADVRVGTDHPARRPLVIVIHGGNWRPQTDRSHTGPMCAAIAEGGWTNASIEYRRTPGAPRETLDDVALAISSLPTLVREHSGRAVAVGQSAGGHLVLWAAVNCASTLGGVLALAPISDLQWGYANAPGDNAIADFLGSSPSGHPDVDPVQMPDAPIPVTIVHGLQDAIAPITMSENYTTRHTAARLVRVEDCGHMAPVDPLSSAWATVIEELQRLTAIG
jgi:acetyl esterase/lipase